MKNASKYAGTAALEGVRMLPPDDRKASEESHRYRKGLKVLCDTDARGHETPRGRSPLEIVVDASEGFVPLWEKGHTLRWTFRKTSFEVFQNPPAAMSYVRTLFGEALLKWGPAAPVKFAQHDDSWDFEIVMRDTDNCRPGGGCVLASAFFPDGGRHQLTIYPKCFAQTRQEQVETLIHEVGHIFGLRHFFAQTGESAFPSQVFGRHSRFSIMNYGNNSVLTADDKADLKRLYDLAWSGELTDINGTPITFMRPFHSFSPVLNRRFVPEELPIAARAPALKMRRR